VLTRDLLQEPWKSRTISRMNLSGISGWQVALRGLTEVQRLKDLVVLLEALGPQELWHGPSRTLAACRRPTQGWSSRNWRLWS